MVEALEQALPVFQAQPLEEKAARDTASRLSALVKSSIDPLALRKNSSACTFGTAIRVHLDRYFRGVKNNPREERRVARETEARKRGGRKGSGKVVPANLIDLELTRQNIGKTLTDLLDSYRQELAEPGEKDYRALAEEMLDYLQKKQTESETRVTKKEAYDSAIQIMKDVGIKEPERRFKQYPHEFSGGMRQRIVIAIAIAANPEILLCDEPTTALDVTIQAQILELINDIKKKRNLSVIFITHDLGVVANVADRVAVMYAGKIVEYGTTDDIFFDPKHPYTWALLSSMPSLDTKDRLEAIPGTPPNMIYPPRGDAFAERNKYAMRIDFKREPPFFKVSDTHYAATWLLHPDAPKTDPPKALTDRIRAMKEMEDWGYDRG